MNGKYKALWLNANGDLEVINQTKLPFIYETKILKSSEDCVRAIKDMVVRGAGVIGLVGAFGVYLACRESDDIEIIKTKAKNIREARPTAVNLMWAVDKMMEVISKDNNKDLVKIAKDKAIKISDEDCKKSLLIAKYGCDKFEEIMREKAKESINVLTHCNAGWLAISDEGSALAPIYEAKRRGIDIHVWVDETRPRNQGANLTAWELARSGVKHTIIADNSGGYLMQQGMVDVCIVGADRVSRQGDVANKIGTYLKALSAKDNSIPFYVALPEGTFDFDMVDGVKDIPIECRSEDEINIIRGVDSEGKIGKLRITPKESSSLNYGFDITPNRLITGLITERGICEANLDAIESNFKDLL